MTGIVRRTLSRSPLLFAAVVVGAVTLAGWTLAETVPVDSASTPGTVADDAAGKPVNAAVATNTKDGKTVVALSIKIVREYDGTVDAANAAVAVASCTDCTTVAIALEGVLVAGSPTDFEPTNVALAINTGCSNCQTLAAAYQAVVQSDGKVRISKAGRQEINDIRRDLHALKKSDLDIETIRQRVEDAAARFIAVLRNEVVPVGRPDSSTSTTTTTEATTSAPTTTTTTEATTTTTVGPTTTTTTAQL